jgi:membrane AbrB-like protein
MHRTVRIAVNLLWAVAAATAAHAARLPLPWLIGPLLATALAGIAGAPVAASQRLRNAGQWAIGVALGLYFTPPVLRQLGQLAPYIAVGVVWALGLGWCFHRFLRHFNPGEAPATTFFAAAIGGASEMAVLADRHQARIDRVAAAHSLRLMLVVLCLPLAFQWAGLHGVAAAEPTALLVHPGGLLALTLATLAGVAVMRWLALPNPWVLGALAVTMVLSASGIVLSALPHEATNAGQLFIGVSLGARFTPAFARAAPRWLASVAVGSVGMIALSAGFGALLGAAAGLHPATGVLATAPGGIAEMCITAKVLQLGVPVVTAFHVLRYLAVLLLTAGLFRWEQRRLSAPCASAP